MWPVRRCQGGRIPVPDLWLELVYVLLRVLRTFFAPRAETEARPEASTGFVDVDQDRLQYGLLFSSYSTLHKWNRTKEISWQTKSCCKGQFS